MQVSFLSMTIDFVLSANADPGEMPHHVAFHVGFHCLPKYLFMGFQTHDIYVTISKTASYFVHV